MSALRNVRKDFEETFKDLGLNVYAYDVEQPKPPCIIVSPSDPYIRKYSAGTKTMNATMTVGYNIIIIGAKGLKPENVDILDDYLYSVYEALEPIAHIGSVGRPGNVELDNGEYFGVVVEVEYNPPRL